ncbi:PREDICTED: uncharacterized protein LOC106806788 isoform X2 [Priapulus caudatus]|uniref:Uncharacterized protein LOC106806788 isoform X2 n=1 Tax=Priapulus caudatus TaxID=37621 RepID=A0ABM1DWN1_PRICU|nr:PREDICTED: uncharacterized protein LOC106806788 isoform X2 [Priapulus caudatus]
MNVHPHSFIALVAIVIVCLHYGVTGNLAENNILRKTSTESKVPVPSYDYGDYSLGDNNHDEQKYSGNDYRPYDNFIDYEPTDKDNDYLIEDDNLPVIEQKYLGEDDGLFSDFLKYKRDGTTQMQPISDHIEHEDIDKNLLSYIDYLTKTYHTSGKYIHSGHPLISEQSLHPPLIGRSGIGSSPLKSSQSISNRVNKVFPNLSQKQKFMRYQHQRTNPYNENYPVLNVEQNHGSLKTAAFRNNRAGSKLNTTYASNFKSYKVSSTLPTKTAILPGSAHKDLNLKFHAKSLDNITLVASTKAESTITAFLQKVLGRLKHIKDPQEQRTFANKFVGRMNSTLELLPPETTPASSTDRAADDPDAPLLFTLPDVRRGMLLVDGKKFPIRSRVAVTAIEEFVSDMVNRINGVQDLQRRKQMKQLFIEEMKLFGEHHYSVKSSTLRVPVKGTKSAAPGISKQQVNKTPKQNPGNTAESNADSKSRKDELAPANEHRVAQMTEAFMERNITLHRNSILGLAIGAGAIFGGSLIAVILICVKYRGMIFNQNGICCRLFHCVRCGCSACKNNRGDSEREGSSRRGAVKKFFRKKKAEQAKARSQFCEDMNFNKTKPRNLLGASESEEELDLYRKTPPVSPSKKFRRTP